MFTAYRVLYEKHGLFQRISKVYFILFKENREELDAEYTARTKTLPKNGKKQYNSVVSKRVNNINFK